MEELGRSTVQPSRRFDDRSAYRRGDLTPVLSNDNPKHVIVAQLEMGRVWYERHGDRGYWLRRGLARPVSYERYGDRRRTRLCPGRRMCASRRSGNGAGGWRFLVAA